MMGKFVGLSTIVPTFLEAGSLASSLARASRFLSFCWFTAFFCLAETSCLLTLFLMREGCIRGAMLLILRYYEGFSEPSRTKSRDGYIAVELSPTLLSAFIVAGCSHSAL